MSIIHRHFQQTLRAEALLGKFPNLSGELENSFRFCPESGESEIFRFLGILRSNSSLEIHIKKFYIKMLFLKKNLKSWSNFWVIFWVKWLIFRNYKRTRFLVESFWRGSPWKISEFVWRDFGEFSRNSLDFCGERREERHSKNFRRVKMSGG